MLQAWFYHFCFFFFPFLYTDSGKLNHQVKCVKNHNAVRCEKNRWIIKLVFNCNLNLLSLLWNQQFVWGKNFGNLESCSLYLSVQFVGTSNIFVLKRQFFSCCFWKMEQHRTDSLKRTNSRRIYFTIKSLTSLLPLSASCWSSLSVSILSFFSTVFFISLWGSLLRCSSVTYRPTSSSFLTGTN